MNYTLITQGLGSNRVKLNEPLSKHTYFKLGGPTDLFYEARTTDELASAVQAAILYKIPYLVIGGGSNLLVTDAGFRGLVIKNRTSNIQLKGFAGGVEKGKLDLKEAIIQADSGVPANQLIRYSLDQGLAGLEQFLGLPGTVGGAIYNNSHHLGALIGDRVVEIEVLDSAGNRQKYLQKDLHFEYDYSALHKTKDIVLTASFLLVHGDKDALWTVANAAVARRSTTQPLGSASSGCMFKNIPLSDAMRLGTPATTQSVGYLIDKAGLKGLRVGGAVVSAVHANFIVNDGTATSQDVLDLTTNIKTVIKAKFGVSLELEVVVVGEKL